MKMKIIPFDLEMAKKIQAGEIKGRIRTKECDFTVRIICFDKIKLIHGDGTIEKQIVSLTYNENAREDVMYVHNQKGEVQTSFGWEHGYDLVLEVPDNIPQESQSNSPYSIEQLDKLKKYTEQLMEVNQGVIDDLDSMIKELEKISNSSLKTEFKPFDKVLVRASEFDKWKANFFSHMDDGYYKCVNSRYAQCIPYAGNEHLVGTTDNPK